VIGVGVTRYKVTVTLLSPFIISSGQDKNGPVQKGPILYNNKPYIPGSTIKGKIRDNFCKITALHHADNNCDCAMCTLFGGKGYKPSKIYVDDFFPVEDNIPDAKNLSIRYGIAINRYSKTNRDNHLYSQEVVNGGKFSGIITVYFDNETLKYKRNIEMAIKMVDNIGGGRSKGFGRAEVQWEEA